MKRLKSTKAIFRAKLATTAHLLHKTDRQITQDYHILKKLRGVLLRTKNERTLKRFKEKMNSLALELGFVPSVSHDKIAMLRKLNIYKKQNSHLRYAAIEHAHVHLCIIFEDLIRRIILKYYEEDIRRLKSQRETIKNDQLVEILLAGHGIHRTLAEKVVDDIMYGSIEDWYQALQKIGVDIQPSPSIKELFLIRNCIVHNDKKVSPQLGRAFPSQYRLRKHIRLSVVGFDKFMADVEHSSTFIISEYNRLFPTNKGTWAD